VDRISEGIENRRDFVRNRVSVLPDIHHGQDHIFRECARAIHADSLRVRAQMPAPGQAVTAASADDVTFPADQISGMKVGNV